MKTFRFLFTVFVCVCFTHAFSQNFGAEMQYFNNIMNSTAQMMSNGFAQMDAQQRVNATATCYPMYKQNDVSKIDHIDVILSWGNNKDVIVVVSNGENQVKLYSNSFYNTSIGHMFSFKDQSVKIGSKITIIRCDDNKVLATYVVPKKPQTQQQVGGQYYQYNQMQSGGIQNNSTQRSVVGRKTCSYCGGKGWIAGSRTTTYGSTTRYYCGQCGEMVNPSHSHDQCPSCRGIGTIPTINY